MSEISVLTLDIGGDSGSAVSATEAVAEALDHLASSAGSAQDSLGGLGGSADSAAEGTHAVAEGGGAASEGLGKAASGALGLSSNLAPIRDVSRAVSEGMRIAGTEGAGSLGLMAAGGVAAVAAIGTLGKVGADWAQEVMRISAATGMNQEQTEVWIRTYEMAGQSGEGLIRTVLILGRDIEAANAGNQKYAGTFDELGISLKNADGSAKSAGTVFEELMKTLANKDPMTQQIELTQLFSARYAGQLLPVVKNFNEIFPEATANVKRHSAEMGEANSIAIGFNKAETDLKSDVQALGVAAVPLLTSALKALDGALSVVLGIVNSMAPLIKGTAEVFDVAAEGVQRFGHAVEEGGKILGKVLDPLGLFSGGAKEAAEDTDQVTTSTKDLVPELGKATEGYKQVADAEEKVATGAKTLKDGMDNSKVGFEDGKQGALDYALALARLRDAEDAVGNTPIGFNSGGQAIFSGGSGLEARAGGGPVQAGRPYLVGEERPELFVPGSSGFIFPSVNNQSSTNIGRQTNGGVVIHGGVTVIQQQGQSIDQLFRTI